MTAKRKQKRHNVWVLNSERLANFFLLTAHARCMDTFSKLKHHGLPGALGYYELIRTQNAEADRQFIDLHYLLYLRGFTLALKAGVQRATAYYRTVESDFERWRNSYADKIRKLKKAAQRFDDWMSGIIRGLAAVKFEAAVVLHTAGAINPAYAPLALTFDLVVAGVDAEGSPPISMIAMASASGSVSAGQYALSRHVKLKEKHWRDKEKEFGHANMETEGKAARQLGKEKFLYEDTYRTVKHNAAPPHAYLGVLNAVFLSQSLWYDLNTLKQDLRAGQ